MTKFRTLDANGDFTFGKGLNNYSRDNNAVKLDVKTRLGSWLGDCFFDTGAGVDWWNRLGSKGQRLLLEQDLRRVILQTDGVTEILEFAVTLVDRKFSASYTVNSIYSKSFNDLVERAL